MFEFVTVKVKCPHCEHSLMDSIKKVDNTESIAMNIAFSGKKGLIYLSSIYGSYNYGCDVQIPRDQIVEFSCPHCGKNLKTGKDCPACSAPLMEINMAEGGVIKFCSRCGCKQHSAEFEDLSLTLKIFHEEYAKYQDENPEEAILTRQEVREKSKLPTHKEIMKTGSYLLSFCPHCNKSLIRDNMIEFKIIRQDDESGYLMLSPYLNVFTHKSTIRLPQDEIAKDILCPSCGHSLIVPNNQCGKCGNRTMKIHVSAMSKLTDFFICTKKGCTWHGLSEQDYNDIALEDSKEW
jgi:predicted RNA-binding Zn-ribbon protein involved in translation (DUF1610 family)